MITDDNNNNNNGHLQWQTCTGPKCLQILYTCTYFQNSMHTTQECVRAHTHTHLYIRVMALKKRVYKKRVFKEELKKLRGRMMDRNRELVPDN